MKQKHNFFKRELETLIPYLVMGVVAVVTFYLIQVCVNLM